MLDNKLHSKNITKVKKILFLTDGSILSGPARLRVFQYISLWQRAGYTTKVFNCRDLIKKDFQEVMLRHEFESSDLIFLNRNLFPKIIFLILNSNKPLIFDFDDALFFIRSSQIKRSGHFFLYYYSVLLYRKLFRGGKYFSGSKKILDLVLSKSIAVIAGNKFLADYATGYNKNVYIIPTAVNVESIAPKEHESKPIVTIGWIGVAQNFLHIDHIAPALIKLKNSIEIDFTLCVVSSKNYYYKGLPIKNIKWNLEGEANIINSFDIGIMPLIDDEFARGKCAFKAVLCMSHGIPVVVSGVGANLTTIIHGETGFIANNTEEWCKYLSLLIKNSKLRKEMGHKARIDMHKRFSVKSNFNKLNRIVQKI